MTQTTEPHNESETSLVFVPSPQETADLSFLEGPAIDLVEVQIDAMSPDQLDAMLAELRNLTMVPGVLGRTLADESVTIAVGKPKTSRSKKRTSIDDLF